MVQVHWPYAGRVLPLRATFPEFYPFVRPNVWLLDRALFPKRHCDPIDGQLCLIGFNTRQWDPTIGLADLLLEQLPHVMEGTGDEHLQGEPPEMWWNRLAVDTSYILVDSRLSLAGAQQGTLELKARSFAAKEKGKPPLIQGAVTAVKDRTGASIPCFVPVPAFLDSKFSMPWIWLDTPPIPDGDDLSLLEAIFQGDAYLKSKRPLFEIDSNLYIVPCALAYPAELRHGVQGVGWTFPYLWGQKSAFSANPKGAKQRIAITATMRAGEDDLGIRVPAIGTLKSKRVSVMGLGALGAPVALDLARNCCRELYLVDNQDVEPGNSVRWPLGATAWGRKKVEVLGVHILQEFPWVDLKSYAFAVGAAIDDQSAGDRKLFADILPNVDIVVDATASYGATTVLWAACSERDIPLISMFASPNVQGGAVVYYPPGGACPICLEHAWHEGVVPRPRGMGLDDEAGFDLVEPPGCAEPTFAGGDFDLLEVSLQAVRLTIAALNDDLSGKGAVVQILTMADSEGLKTLPSWTEYDLPLMAKCRCHPAE